VGDINYSPSERLRVFIGVLLGYMFDGWDLLVISFTLFAIAQTFNVPTTTISPAVTLSLIGSVIGGIFFGWMADKVGRRKTLMITIIVFGITTFFTALAQSVFELMILRFIAGLGVGGEWGIGYSMLNEAWPSKTRGISGGILQSMFVVGSLAASATSGLALSTFGLSEGWRISFIIAGLASLFSIYVRFGMPESKVWLQLQELKSKGMLPKGYQLRNPLREIFSRDVRKYTLFGSVMASAYLFFAYSFLTYIPTYFGTVLKIPITTYTIMIVIAQLFGIMGYIINGWLSDILGRKKTAIIYGLITFISIISFYIALLLNTFFTSIVNFPLFYAYIAVYFSAGFIGNFGVWMGELFPTKMRATGENFAYMIGRGIGAGLAPPVIPIFASSVGLGMGMVIGMAIGAIVQFIAIFGLKESKGTIIKPL
jgi:SHS family lactate transporter-like MFS transporter